MIIHIHVVGLFINVGKNQSILDNRKYVFVYDEVSDFATREQIKNVRTHFI